MPQGKLAMLVAPEAEQRAIVGPHHGVEAAERDVGHPNVRQGLHTPRRELLCARPGVEWAVEER